MTNKHHFSRFSASVEAEVPFHDVDTMEVVWHGHYVKYFEIARSALLDQFDYNYPQMRESGYAWPVVDLHIRYIKPARFGQRIRIHARLEEWEYRLKISYVIEDVQTATKLTKGYTVQVAVNMHDGLLCYISPAILAQKLGITPV